MKAKISKTAEEILSNKESRKQLFKFLVSHDDEGIINVDDKKYKIIRGCSYNK